MFTSMNLDEKLFQQAWPLGPRRGGSLPRGSALRAMREERHRRAAEAVLRKDSSTALVLVNAVYFKGKWVLQFDRKPRATSRFIWTAAGRWKRR